MGREKMAQNTVNEMEKKFSGSSDDLHSGLWKPMVYGSRYPGPDKSVLFSYLGEKVVRAHKLLVHRSTSQTQSSVRLLVFRASRYKKVQRFLHTQIRIQRITQKGPF